MPRKVETEVLTLSRRRCCLCFGLHGDLRIRRGQVAHLDHNPANNDPANLAWLCLDHHTEYDETMVIEYIEKRAGLLTGQGDPGAGRQRQFTFPHRTFQEFLAAGHLATQVDLEDRAAGLARNDPGHWREVLRFAARLAGKSRGVSLADALVNREYPPPPGAETDPDPAVCGCASLSGEALIEIGIEPVESVAGGHKVLERARSWLVAVLERSRLPALERARAGRALGRLGDPRQNVVPLTLDELACMGFCLVPAGPPVMGEGKERHLDASLDYDYWIARYPVTVAQYRLFVQARGYEEARYWREAEVAGLWRKGGFKARYESEWSTGPWRSGEPFETPNHPQSGVSWYEALAFCRWLSEVMVGRLANRWHLRLPSEAEWEKAARGGQEVPPPGTFETKSLLAGLAGGALEASGREEPDHVYPWGLEFDPDRANAKPTGIGATSAVGAFPLGRSPYGAEEMAGNVWEWSQGRPHPDFRDDKREREATGPDDILALRGGSWADSSESLRCAARYRHSPFTRYGSVGFRVVASPLRR